MCFGGLLCVPFCFAMIFFASYFRQVYRRIQLGLQLRFGKKKTIAAGGESSDMTKESGGVDHELWATVLRSCVAPCDPEVTRSDGLESVDATNLFDYHLCLRDETLSKAIDAYLQELAKVNLKSLTSNEELCVFLNGYHAHLVNAILKHMKEGGVEINTIQDLNGRQQRRKCTKSATERSVGVIGGSRVSLASIVDKLHEWQDARVDLALCKSGSMSDPNLCSTPFLPQVLNEQLDTSTRNFLFDESKGVQITSDGTILVSQVLLDNFHLPISQSAEFIGRYRRDVRPDAAVLCKLPYNNSLNMLPCNGGGPGAPTLV